MSQNYQIMSRSIVLTMAIAVGLLVLISHDQINASTIGYFEDYGWPTYGIVKPFWMTPFSAFPSRSISAYSMKHSMYNGRGIRKYRGY